jgi:hypothetical protein
LDEPNFSDLTLVLLRDFIERELLQAGNYRVKTEVTNFYISLCLEFNNNYLQRPCIEFSQLLLTDIEEPVKAHNP